MNRINELWDSTKDTVIVTLYVLMFIALLCLIVMVTDAR